MLIAMLCCSAVLAYIILREKLHIFGILGCVLCVVGSTTIVLHAPQERGIESVKEVWDLATEPGMHLEYFYVEKVLPLREVIHCLNFDILDSIFEVFLP